MLRLVPLVHCRVAAFGLISYITNKHTNSTGANAHIENKTRALCAHNAAKLCDLCTHAEYVGANVMRLWLVCGFSGFGGTWIIWMGICTACGSKGVSSQQHIFNIFRRMSTAYQTKTNSCNYVQLSFFIPACQPWEFFVSAVVVVVINCPTMVFFSHPHDCSR